MRGGHVRVGSKGDLTAPKFDFRSSPESGLKSDIGPCPVLHNKRHAGLDHAIAKGWLWKHESGTYVKFTQAGADLFA